MGFNWKWMGDEWKVRISDTWHDAKDYTFDLKELLTTLREYHEELEDKGLSFEDFGVSANSDWADCELRGGEWDQEKNICYID